jgi:hypothetical protein
VSTILSELRSYPRSLYFILAIGLTLRLLFIGFHQRPLISDEREYDGLAYSLASTATYSYEGVSTAYRPVGYPAIVGSLYYVAGHFPIAVKCFQAVLDVGTAFLLFLLLAGYSDRIRLLAAGLWTLYIPAILYSNLLMSETVSAFLLTLTAFLICRSSGSRPGTLTSIGICLGILVLIKPGTLILPILLLFLLPRLDIPLKMLYPAAFAFVLVLAPWIARNYILFDRFALSSNGGINLLIGNNPHTTGAYGITFDPEILRDTKGEFAADRQAFQWAARYIAGHPGEFAVNAVKKVGRLFESEGGLLVLTFHGNPEESTTHYASKYASIPLLLTLLTNLSYFIVLILAVLGFLASRRDPLWWFTLALAGSWGLVHMVYFGGGRFHFPLMPFAAIFAATSLRGGSESIKNLPRRKAIIGAIIILLLSSLWIYEGVMVFNG